MTTFENSPDFLSSPCGYRVSEFCEIARISRATFFRLVKAQKLKTIHYGGITIVTKEEANRFFTEGTGKAKAA